MNMNMNMNTNTNTNTNGTTVTEFGWPDYAVFSLSLVTFTAVGVYSVLAPSSSAVGGNGSARGSEKDTDEAKEELIGDRCVREVDVNEHKADR